MPNPIFDLLCPRCGSSSGAGTGLCACGSPLIVNYDLERAGSLVSRSDLVSRPHTLWRYRELLPVPAATSPVTLGEGGTPLLPLTHWGQSRGLADVWLKDEGLNPTGTFKARGAAVGVTMARELGATEVALPTAGNAGGAWALYAARAGLRCHVVMPADAPRGALAECVAAGADVRVVDGLISDAGRIIARGVTEQGWYDAGTLREPYRIEGKKTMGLEIAEQFGWSFPDVIAYPCGGGVGLIGIWLAYQQLVELGWVRPEPRPRMVAVQAEGCAPIVKAFQEGAELSEFWNGARTIAAGIRVPKALGDFLVLRAVRDSEGTAVTVSDADMLRTMLELGRDEGTFICPEGAAAAVAVQRLREGGWIRDGERVVVLNTGSGLKYVDLLDTDVPLVSED